MVFSLNDSLAKLPLPATPKWPHGVWDYEAFKHGSMSLIVYHPHVKDFQTTHEQDELYIVMSGTADLIIEGKSHACKTGDALFVPASKNHRFENFSEDFIVWAIFWGPKGGELSKR
jgi:mannose-6-phosphate isomerase-like protein (cupin superfamily)